jgi:hypothetical protein
MSMNTHHESKGGLLGGWAEGLARFWRRRARVEELRALDNAMLAQLAEDVGISPAELLSLAGYDEDSADLLLRRLDEMGIDPSRIDPAILRDLNRCCTQCDSKATCKRELDARPAQAARPKYCPNQETLTALAGMKCH